MFIIVLFVFPQSFFSTFIFVLSAYQLAFNAQESSVAEVSGTLFPKLPTTVAFSLENIQHNCLILKSIR